MNNRFAQAEATFGPPGIGRIATADTSGFPALGCYRRKKACSGHPATGHGRMTPTSGIRVTGDLSSAFTAALTTASAIQAPAFTAATGATTVTFTTATSTT